MHILNFQEFLFEKKVTIKRKYTENHPAKHVSTSARVRNVVLDAMSDGVITEEELKNILSEIKAHNKWLKKNQSLFKLEEDENGNTIYRLSKRGSRIKNRTREIND